MSKSTNMINKRLRSNVGHTVTMTAQAKQLHGPRCGYTENMVPAARKTILIRTGTGVDGGACRQVINTGFRYHSTRTEDSQDRRMNNRDRLPLTETICKIESMSLCYECLEFVLVIWRIMLIVK